MKRPSEGAATGTTSPVTGGEQLVDSTSSLPAASTGTVASNPQVRGNEGGFDCILRDGANLVERIAAAAPGSEIALDPGRYVIPDDCLVDLGGGLVAWWVDAVHLSGSKAGTTELVMPSGAILGIQGGAVLSNLTLRLSDRPVVLVQGSSLVGCRVVADETLRHTWDMSSGTWPPLVKVDDGRVTSCHIEGLFVGVGVGPASAGTSATAHVQGCVISSCQGAGIKVFDGEAVVRLNTVSGCKVGIEVAAAAHGVVEGNHCHSNKRGLLIDSDDA